MQFYVGLHHPSDAHRFDRAFVSVNRLKMRKCNFEPRQWIMDSGAFSEVSKFGEFRTSLQEYAWQIRRWSFCGTMDAAVSQDWMCEPWIIERTGLDVPEHQRRTIDRYDRLNDRDLGRAYLMPVLQGFAVDDYMRHLDAYGVRLKEGAWVGVGSVCKRQGKPQVIAEILSAIKAVRPDLRLHGFGVKITALRDKPVRDLLHSADSMAWSFAERRSGGDANHWHGAAKFVQQIEEIL